MSEESTTQAHAEECDDPQDCRRWRRRADARPGEILDAAVELFVEKGFAATRMEEIAQRAGVTKGTVYLYYAGKEELFRAVIQDMVLPVLAEGERFVAEWRGDSRELFGAMIHRWWTGIQEPRFACLKLITGEAANFPEAARYYVNEVVHRGRRLFESVLRRGMERGEFRADLDLPSAGRLAVAPLLNAALYKNSLLRYDDEPFDFDAYVSLHIDLFLCGIAENVSKGS
ncbi:MAG TPA: TetR/AcrR family transcriptional regulator [Longimicrobiaceae bacterium]|nr:TetR/AcrR family transcriptional regulator [Longimicrobiaceae bacterium]